jgi:hypothetical protein
MTTVDLLTRALAKKIYFPSGERVYPSGFSIWPLISPDVSTPGAGVSVSP